MNQAVLNVLIALGKGIGMILVLVIISSLFKKAIL